MIVRFDDDVPVLTMQRNRSSFVKNSKHYVSENKKREREEKRLDSTRVKLRTGHGGKRVTNCGNRKVENVYISAGC